MQFLFVFLSFWLPSFTTPLSSTGTPTVTISGGPFMTEPDSVNLPIITITQTLPSGDDGSLFFATFRGFNDLVTPNYLIILDGNGEYLYFTRTPENRIAMDFKVTEVAGIPNLSYFLTDEFRAAWGEGDFRVLDPTYQEIDRWTTTSDYVAENHELLLLDNGNALLMAYDPVPMDLSAYGGKADATVIDVVIQELTASRTVAFEWHSLDHVPVTNTYVSLTTEQVDYAHANSLDIDTDGNLLVSLRNTSLLKIDRDSGEILWQLGGRTSDFFFTNDNGFAFQHDARRLTNGNLTLFDNGNGLHSGYSRAVEYAVNENTKTVTRTWQVTDTYTVALGNAQRLPSGNTLVNWGLAGKLTEATADEAVARTIHLGGDSTYRAFRLPWAGQPSTPPKLAIRTANTATTLYMSWNGATEVERFRIYGGAEKTTLTLIDTLQKSGFETSYQFELALDDERCFWQIEAVDGDGIGLQRSTAQLRDTPFCLRTYGRQRYLPLINQ